MNLDLKLCLQEQTELHNFVVADSKAHVAPVFKVNQEREGYWETHDKWEKRRNITTQTYKMRVGGIKQCKEGTERARNGGIAREGWKTILPSK